MFFRFRVSVVSVFRPRAQTSCVVRRWPRRVSVASIARRWTCVAYSFPSVASVARRRTCLAYSLPYTALLRMSGAAWPNQREKEGRGGSVELGEPRDEALGEARSWWWW